MTGEDHEHTEPGGRERWTGLWLLWWAGSALACTLALAILAAFGWAIWTALAAYLT